MKFLKTMKTLLLILLTSSLVELNAQDFIKSDIALKVQYGFNPEIFFNEAGKAIIFDDRFYQDLKDDFSPNGDNIYINVSQSIAGVDILQVAHFAEDYFVLFWSCYFYDNTLMQNKYRLAFQVFDYAGDSVSPALTIDENMTGYNLRLFASKSPDNDNELGIAWAVTDTLFCSYLNFEEQTIGEKQAILTGTGANYWYIVDFQQDGSKRLVWLDINGNLRHKKIAKNGSTQITESILISTDKITYPAFKRYNSLDDGHFYLSVFCTNPVTSKYGIQIFRYNPDATLINSPVWATETIDNISVNESEEMFCLSVQDDGKMAAVWTEYFDYPNSFLYMQLMDAEGNKYGNKFIPTTINTETFHKGGYNIMQINPSVTLKNDTIVLIWANYNNEISMNNIDYVNVQKYTMPEVTDISANLNSDLKYYTNRNLNGSWDLTIYTNQASLAIITLSDIIGRTGSINTYLNEGENRVSLDALIKNTFSDQHGVYIYKVSVLNKEFSGKLIY